MREEVVHFTGDGFQRLRRLNKLFASFLLPGEAAFGVALTPPLGKTLLMTFAKALLLTFGHSPEQTLLQPFLKTVHQLTLVIGGADTGSKRFFRSPHAGAAGSGAGDSARAVFQWS